MMFLRDVYTFLSYRFQFLQPSACGIRWNFLPSAHPSISIPPYIPLWCESKSVIYTCDAAVFFSHLFSRSSVQLEIVLNCIHCQWYHAIGFWHCPSHCWDCQNFVQQWLVVGTCCYHQHFKDAVWFRRDLYTAPKSAQVCNGIVHRTIQDLAFGPMCSIEVADPCSVNVS